MGNEDSRPVQKGNEVTGQATSIVIEEGMSRVDTWHTALLVILTTLVVLQCAYLIFRQYQKTMKKKYMERTRPPRNHV